MKKRYPILTLITLLLVLIAGCGFLGAGVVATPSRSIPISPEASQQFEAAFVNAQLDAQTNTATIRITEPQITSYVYYQLQAQPNQGVRNPQIYLENNQVVMYVQVVADPINTTGRIALSANVKDGNPKVDIVSAEFGAFTLPTGLMDWVSGLINNAIVDNMNTSGVDFQLVSINITDRVLVIVARPK
jgi:hypothetical protein